MKRILLIISLIALSFTKSVQAKEVNYWSTKYTEPPVILREIICEVIPLTSDGWCAISFQKIYFGQVFLYDNRVIYSLFDYPKMQENT